MNMDRRLQRLEGRAGSAGPRKLSAEEQAEAQQVLASIEARIQADPVGEANRQAALEELLYYTQHRLGG